MNTNLIQPEDYKYFVSRPDSNFSPQRNKAIINETIVETEKFFEEIASKIDAEGLNRIDIVATYGRYRFNKGHKNFKSYIGDRLYKELIGEKVLSKVRVMESVNRLNGNTKFKNHILL